MINGYEKVWIDYEPYTESYGHIELDETYSYTSYTRTDVSQARITELEEALQSILQVPNSEAAQGIMKVFAEFALKETP
jgi:hypothetical protein